MQISTSTISKVEAEYLIFLTELYISSKDLSEESNRWLLVEIGHSIYVTNPSHTRSRIVDLLVKIQKLREGYKKSCKI